MGKTRPYFSPDRNWLITVTTLLSNLKYLFLLVALYIHDPVYRLASPGKFLDTVGTWGEGLQKLGLANTAYWPNQVVEVPTEVS